MKALIRFAKVRFEAVALRRRLIKLGGGHAWERTPRLAVC